MKKILSFLILILISYSGRTQTTSIEPIGQTPGGSGYTVNWDSINQQLIVGCGTSVWLYDCSDTSDFNIIAKRPLLGLINETELYGDILFAAATHDGIWALDYTSSQLDVLAHYQFNDDDGAYDMWRTNDTLYVATEKNITVLKYIPGSGFTMIDEFGGSGAFCVSRRGEYITVGTRGFQGNVSVYHFEDLINPIASWQSNLVGILQDIQFADLRDDIIYLCGGPADLLSLKSYFFALLFDGSSISVADSFVVDGGVPLVAQMNVQNMDSRNDTVFLATGAAYDQTTMPMTYMPILDCSGLPSAGIDSIGHVIPGLWHFDPSLMDGTPYIAMSSEWLGVLISDVSQLNPFDTLGLLETGGWCTNTRIIGETVWACLEGFGIAAYQLDSLYFNAGTMTDSRLMHYFTQFVSDFDILNDTLLILNTSEILDLKPMLQGGSPVYQRTMSLGWISSVRFIETNVGTRLIAGFNPLGPDKQMLLYDPFDSINNYPQLYSDTVKNDVMSMHVISDTLYCGKKFGNDYYLSAFKVQNDEFIMIDTIKAPGEITGISSDGNKIAVSCMASGFAWYSFDGSTFTQLGEYFDFFIRAVDIALKNNLVYVANKFQGLKIYDVSQTTAEEVAYGKGTMGWCNVFGSSAIDVGEDGQIYLGDFNAGVIIFGAYDSTLTSNDRQIITNNKQGLSIYPNPAENEIFIDFSNDLSDKAIISVYDITGRIVENYLIENTGGESQLKIDISNFPNGLYILNIQTNVTYESRMFEVVR